LHIVIGKFNKKTYANFILSFNNIGRHEKMNMIALGHSSIPKNLSVEIQVVFEVK